MYYVTWYVDDSVVLAGDPVRTFETFTDAVKYAQQLVTDGTFESLYYETFTVPEPMCI